MGNYFLSCEDLCAHMEWGSSKAFSSEADRASCLHPRDAPRSRSDPGPDSVSIIVHFTLQHEYFLISGLGGGGNFHTRHRIFTEPCFESVSRPSHAGFRPEYRRMITDGWVHGFGDFPPHEILKWKSRHFAFN